LFVVHVVLLGSQQVLSFWEFCAVHLHAELMHSWALVHVMELLVVVRISPPPQPTRNARPATSENANKVFMVMSREKRRCALPANASPAVSHSPQGPSSNSSTCKSA
jgi:hypothetical protein